MSRSAPSGASTVTSRSCARGSAGVRRTAKASSSGLPGRSNPPPASLPQSGRQGCQGARSPCSWSWSRRWASHRKPSRSFSGRPDPLHEPHNAERGRRHAGDGVRRPDGRRLGSAEGQAGGVSGRAARCFGRASSDGPRCVLTNARYPQSHDSVVRPVRSVPKWRRCPQSRQNGGPPSVTRPARPSSARDRFMRPRARGRSTPGG